MPVKVRYRPHPDSTTLFLIEVKRSFWYGWEKFEVAHSLSEAEKAASKVKLHLNTPTVEV
jgi:hypothetical protein